MSTGTIRSAYPVGVHVDTFTADVFGISLKDVDIWDDDDAVSNTDLLGFSSQHSKDFGDDFTIDTVSTTHSSLWEQPRQATIGVERFGPSSQAHEICPNKSKSLPTTSQRGTTRPKSQRRLSLNMERPTHKRNISHPYFASKKSDDAGNEDSKSLDDDISSKFGGTNDKSFKVISKRTSPCDPKRIAAGTDGRRQKMVRSSSMKTVTKAPAAAPSNEKSKIRRTRSGSMDLLLEVINKAPASAGKNVKREKKEKHDKGMKSGRRCPTKRSIQRSASLNSSRHTKLKGGNSSSTTNGNKEEGKSTSGISLSTSSSNREDKKSERSIHHKPSSFHDKTSSSRTSKKQTTSEGRRERKTTGVRSGNRTSIG